MRDVLTAGELSAQLEAKIADLAPAWLAQQHELRARLVHALADSPDEALLPTMAYEEFLAWTQENQHAEWVDGKVVVMSPAATRHQELVVFLITLLNLLVRRRNLGRVLTAPYQMRLQTPPRGREPDLLFVATEHLDRLTPTYLDGPADLVVEIVSAESVTRDRVEKFAEYETAGVHEYWLIDPEQESAEFYRLDGTGQYTLMQGGRDGRYASAVIAGLVIDAAWLWQDPLPSVWEIEQR